MSGNTQLKYLSDTYLCTYEANLLHYSCDERGPYSLFDQTIFYPQGGGQPSDTGAIQLGEKLIDIKFVGFHDGHVRHYFSDNSLDIDFFSQQPCVLRIDMARRLNHAKLHTAGHLISGLVDSQRGSLRASKGFHFEEGPYVEFEGEPEGDANAFLVDLQAKIDLLIAEAPEVVGALVGFDELKKRCWNTPANLPSDKALRTITIQSLDPVPCGGTHVRCLSELGSVTLVKLKKRKGFTKVSYRVSTACS
jgi:Ser-tRNA(Ala) deacylase AlaX